MLCRRGRERVSPLTIQGINCNCPLIYDITYWPFSRMVWRDPYWVIFDGGIQDLGEETWRRAGCGKKIQKSKNPKNPNCVWEKSWRDSGFQILEDYGITVLTFLLISLRYFYGIFTVLFVILDLDSTKLFTVLRHDNFFCILVDNLAQFRPKMSWMKSRDLTKHHQ